MAHLRHRFKDEKRNENVENVQYCISPYWLETLFYLNESCDILICLGKNRQHRYKATKFKRMLYETDFLPK